MSSSNEKVESNSDWGSGCGLGCGGLILLGLLSNAVDAYGGWIVTLAIIIPIFLGILLWLRKVRLECEKKEGQEKLALEKKEAQEKVEREKKERQEKAAAKEKALRKKNAALKSRFNQLPKSDAVRMDDASDD